MTTNHESNKTAILERAQAAGWPCVVSRGMSVHGRGLWERAVSLALPMDIEDLARQLPSHEAAVAKSAAFDAREAAREERLTAAHATDELDAARNRRVDELGEAHAKLAPERRLAKTIATAIADELKGAR